MAFLDALRGALLANPRLGLVAPALQVELLRLRLDRSYAWRSQRLLQETAVRLGLRAYRGREPVVFTSIMVPPELLYALGLVPFGVEVAGAVTSMLGLASQCLAAAERAWAPADSCSVLRAALGGAELGLLPRPLAAVCTSCPCDSTAKVYAHVARQAGPAPLLLLDVPYEQSPDAVAYLAEQLAAATATLAELAGRKLEPARLAEAVRLSNEARRHVLAVMAQRRARPGLLASSDALGFVYPWSLFLGSPAGVAVFRSYAEELAEAPARPAPEGPRLMWLHFMPFYAHELVAALEGAGAAVVCEEMTQLYWDEADPAQPFVGLARRCISHFLNVPTEERIERLLAVARDYQVDGAVHFSHHGCRQSQGALRVMRDGLAAAGVPLMEVEGDLIDPRGRGEGQHRTRLEAFVETLA